MKIKIYAIGHLKEAYLKQGINEYLERIKPYSQIEIVEVNDEPIPNNPSIIVPNGIKLSKLLTASPNKNFIPDELITDLTVNIVVVIFPD
jgi:23S rRNA (pseudouridine1915-N3)-methyltransferase